MGLFSRRSPAVEVPVSTVWATVLGASQGFCVLSSGDEQSGGTPLVEADDRAGLAAAIAAGLRASSAVARSGGDLGPLGAQIAAHPWIRGDWIGATAAGVRAWSVAATRTGLVVTRFGLTAHGPEGPRPEPLNQSSSTLLRIDAPQAGIGSLEEPAWAAGPWWAQIVDFLHRTVSLPGLVSGWWVPDLLDRSRAAGPLEPDHAPGIVTAFLRRTEEAPDTGGPPAHGFVPAERSGRWLWLYRWDPFAGDDSFPGAVGLVDTDGEVTLHHWPSRTEVVRLAVRGRDSWSIEDRRRLSGIYRELAGAAGLPESWQRGGVG